jgi:hypothetical protein
MTTSYQNSYPGQLNISAAEDAEETVDYEYQYQQKRARRQQLLVVATLLLVTYLAVGGGTASSGLRMNPTALRQDIGDVPKPDYNGEGRYDWQKCKESKDPDCWKEEGKRVGSYWESFRDRIKGFFQRLFGKKTVEETEAPAPEPEAPEPEAPAEEPLPEPEGPPGAEPPVPKHKHVTAAPVEPDDSSS